MVMPAMRGTYIISVEFFREQILSLSRYFPTDMHAMPGLYITTVVRSDKKTLINEEMGYFKLYDIVFCLFRQKTFFLSSIV